MRHIKRQKRKGRLNTQDKRPYSLWRGGWGGNRALDFSFVGPLLPVCVGRGVVLPASLEGRSEIHGVRISQTVVRLRHFSPVLKPILRACRQV